jgi:hypothetical protein
MEQQQVKRSEAVLNKKSWEEHVMLTLSEELSFM